MVLQYFTCFVSLFRSHVDAYIVSATLSHFKMKKITDDVIPPGIRDSNIFLQRAWLHKKIEGMLDTHAMNHLGSSFSDVKEQIELYTQNEHTCEDCGMVDIIDY